VGLVAEGEHRVMSGHTGAHDHELHTTGKLGQGRDRRRLDELDVEAGGSLAHGLVGAIVDGDDAQAVPD
jgi:hypothetical protein